MKKELKATTQKSYYKKAYVIENENSVQLQSYDTIVCEISGGEFRRLWGGYSVTTMNHINDFRMLHGLSPINKKAWMSMPCDNKKQYRIVITNGFTRVIKSTTFDNFDDAEDYADTLCDGFRTAYAVEV